MSIVTREIINKDIIFTDVTTYNYESTVYDYYKLSKEIDKFKNLLQKYNAISGNSIIIGIHPSIEQIAAIFASLELGMVITIIDYGRKDNFQHYKYMDPKTEILLPVDFFIVENSSSTDKFNYFSRICNTAIVCSSESFDYNENNTIECTPESDIIKCTSSGTTGTPKKITHTHEFFSKLVERNSVFFDNTVGLGFNLNHGSSIATYFLPALASKKVKKFVNFMYQDDERYTESFSYQLTIIENLNHLMMPYRNFLEQIAKYKNPNLTLYTLSVIPSKLKIKYQDCYKDIISFFGSNETSGPVFINRINDTKYQEESYFEIDNFFAYKLFDKKLHVKLPVYNHTINTQDEFYFDNDVYYFLGRNDLQRINGMCIRNKSYSRIVQEFVNGELVYDYLRQEIYLAIWDKTTHPKKIVKKINKKIKRISRSSHYITKVAVLDREEFLSGVKLDQELLREYFRRYVDSNMI